MSKLRSPSGWSRLGERTDRPPDWADVRRRADTLAGRAHRLRRRRAFLLTGTFVVLAGVAAPALGLHDPIVRFFEGEPAPEPVRASFASLDEGAPVPEWRTGVVAGDDAQGHGGLVGRKASRAVYGSEVRRPCTEWSGGGGGCDKLGSCQLDVGYGSSDAFRPGPDGFPPAITWLASRTRGGSTRSRSSSTTARS